MCEQRMNIDGINMIKIELDLAVDFLELGNIGVQQLQMMHLPKSLSNPLGMSENIHERVIHAAGNGESDH